MWGRVGGAWEVVSGGVRTWADETTTPWRLPSASPGAATVPGEGHRNGERLYGLVFWTVHLFPLLSPPSGSWRLTPGLLRSHSEEDTRNRMSAPITSLPKSDHFRIESITGTVKMIILTIKKKVGTSLSFLSINSLFSPFCFHSTQAGQPPCTSIPDAGPGSMLSSHTPQAECDVGECFPEASQLQDVCWESLRVLVKTAYS